MSSSSPTDAIARQQLPNGALLLAKERPTSGVVALTVALRSGARDEPEEEAGARNLLARAHLLGTERWPTEDALRRAIGVTGGGIGVAASHEITTISVTVPADEQQLAFEVLADILNAPRFAADQIERDRNLVRIEIQRRSADPAPLAFDTLVETVWRGHPGGHPVLGRPETIDRIDRDRLLALRQQAFVGANTTVAVVGQIAAERAFAALEQVVGPLPAGTPADRTPCPIPPRASDERIERVAGQRQALVVIGLPTPGRRDPDRYALAIIDAVLGSPSGRLFAEIRTRRALAYVAGSGLSLLSDTGLFYAQAGTDPANVEQVIALIGDELRRIIEQPLTAAELQAAAGQLAGRRIMAEETSGAQANQLATLTALDCYESAEAFAEQVRRVTADDVLRVARRYLDAGRALVIVRPAVPG